jgi:antitoxin MazE
MKTRLVRIGNSRGIRIPKTILEQAGLQEEVEILVEHNSLVIRSVKKPRDGWNEALSGDGPTER